MMYYLISYRYPIELYPKDILLNNIKLIFYSTISPIDILSRIGYPIAKGGATNLKVGRRSMH